MSGSAQRSSFPPRDSRKAASAPSFETVFRLHHGFVWRNLARLGVPDRHLDDALQDVFVVVHRRLPTYVRRAPIRSWLFEIVRRIAWRHRTAARRHHAQSDGVDGLESNARSVHDELELRDDLQRLDAWLSELDEDKRCAFVLSELENLRGPEIADVLGVNVNTVYARVRAARQHVQRHMRRQAALEPMGVLRQAHRRTRPSTDRRRKVMAALVVETGASFATKAAAPAAAISGLKIATAVTIALVASAVTLGVRGNDEPPADEVATTRHAAVQPPPAPAPRAEPVVAEAPPQPAASPVVAPQPEPVAPRPRPHRRAPSPEPEAGDALARDVALLGQARRELRQGSPEGALRTVSTLLTRSPSSQIEPEALALRIAALCSLGRESEATQEAAAFARTHAQTTLVDPDRPCGDKP